MDEMTLVSLIAFCTLMPRRLVIFSPIFMFCEMMTFVVVGLFFCETYSFRKEGKKLKNENFFGRLEGMMVNEDDCSKVKALNCHFDHISVES